MTDKKVNFRHNFDVLEQIAVINAMKRRLLAMTIIIIAAAIPLLQQYQTSQAYPCLGGSTKEYCTGYHNGAIQADQDYNTGHDLDISQHQCIGNSTDYCNGYIKGYNDEADFLG
jgi:hypothetical protein